MRGTRVRLGGAPCDVHNATGGADCVTFADAHVFGRVTCFEMATDVTAEVRGTSD